MKIASPLILAVSFLLSFGSAIQAEPLRLPPKADPELVKDVGNKAIAELLQEMIKAPRLAPTNAPREFAILPLERDLEGDYFTSQLRNEYTRICGPAGYRLYTPRETAEWDALLKEIKWGEDFGGDMEASTVQKFGKFHGFAGLIRGRVVSVSVSDDGILKARVTCQAFVVETGEQIWGAERTGQIQLKTRLETRDLKPYLIPGLAGLVLLGVIWKVRSAIARARRPR